MVNSCDFSLTISEETEGEKKRGNSRKEKAQDSEDSVDSAGEEEGGRGERVPSE